MKHYSFPKIRQYHQVLRDLKLHHQYVGKDENGDPIFDSSKKLPIIEFQGVTKIHGTNSAIVFSPDGSFYCQSRENVIDEVKDNAGFAHWVNKEGHKIWDTIDIIFHDKIQSMFELKIKHVVIFGEWAGGSIQKGVAMNELPKMFIIFGLKVIYEDENTEWLDSSSLGEMPEINVYNIARIPTYNVEVDLNRPDKAIEKMMQMVEEVENECPFAKSFGVSGIGEGLVFRAKGQNDFSNSYKVKGEKHSKSKIKKLPTVDVVKMDNIQEAVETHCHEDRMQQIYDKIVLTEADKVPQKIGLFVQKCLSDIWEEEGDSLRASDICRKDFGKALSKPCATWFKNKISIF